MEETVDVVRLVLDGQVQRIEEQNVEGSISKKFRTVSAFLEILVLPIT